MSASERSADREAIQEVKARYFRFLDTKQWEAFAEVFTEDATMQSGPSGHPPVVGSSAIAAYVRASVERLVTVHHGHMPEIGFTGPDTATGIWAMYDQLRGPEGFAMDGFGHYHETYRRGADGAWRIASTRLTRLRVESSSPGIARALWPEAPDWALEHD
jgi:uncharacterized protein (TIGR02246 family)